MRRRKPNVLADPELVDLLHHDPELLAIADAIAETQPVEHRSHRRTVLLAAAVAGALLVLALPAVAAFTTLIDFSDAPKADDVVVRDFDRLEQQAPAGMDPRVIAAEARRIDLPLTGRDRTAVYLAPTRTGGFCLEIVGLTLGCDATRSLPAEIGLAAPGLAERAIVYGWLHDPRAAAAVVTTARGTTHRAQLVRVTAPIDASLFVVPVDDLSTALPIDVVVTDTAGEPIATKTIPIPPR